MNALSTLETSNVPLVGQGFSGSASSGILSTYPPTPCGLATFNAALSAELLSIDPRQRVARELLTDYADTVAKPNGDSAWPWPEPRLTYANAVLPEAMIAAGVALDDSTLRQQGLGLLGWLVEHETAEGYLSPTHVAGRGPDDLRPAFDQQPIEVSTLADACADAVAIDPALIWPDGVRAAAAWFMAINNARQLTRDLETGGGFDGLHANGVNRNQGAESALAVLSTLQHVRRFSAVRQ